MNSRVCDLPFGCTYWNIKFQKYIIMQFIKLGRKATSEKYNMHNVRICFLF